MASRTALAPLPNGTSRLSMAPQRKSLAPGAAPPRQSMAAAPRVSMAPDVLSRKSSVGSTHRQSSMGTAGRKSLGPRPSGSRVAQDPRNFGTDKTLLKQYTHNVIEYLAEQQYPKQISQKMLSAPSNKDFYAMFEFMYQQFDPTFKMLKPEEDVIFMFKTLKYPFPISKRNITGAIGAPHTWPHILAALNWVVELLRAQQLSNEPGLDADGWANDAVDTQQFFEFICKSYPPWLEGNDDTPSLDEELQIQFENRNNTNRAEIDNFTSIKDEVTAETEAIVNAGDRVEAANKKKATLEADAQKFMGFCDRLHVAIQEAQTRLNDCNRELEMREAELAATANEKSRLQGIIAMQEQQAIDISKINAKRATLNENLEAATGQKERIDAANWEDEMKLSRKMDDIDKLLQQYHQVATRLQLVGPDTKNANGINYQISFDRHSVSAENGISGEIKHTIKPGCKNLLIEISDKIRATQSEILREREDEKGLQETIQDKQEDLKTLEVKLKKLETALHKEKEKVSDDVKKMDSEIERVTQEISNMRESSKTRAAKSLKSLEAIKLEESEQIRRIAEETQARRDSILYMIDVLVKHREWLHNHFANLDEFVRNDYANSVKQFDAASEKIVRVLK